MPDRVTAASINDQANLINRWNQVMADTYPLLDCEDVELDGADVWAGRDGDGPRLEASLLSFP